MLSKPLNIDPDASRLVFGKLVSAVTQRAFYIVGAGEKESAMVSLAELKAWKESSTHWNDEFLTAQEKKSVAYHETSNHASGKLGGNPEELVACAMSFLEQNNGIFDCGTIGSSHEEQ